MDHASVSVIIPAFQAAPTIKRAVASVLAQTVPALEVLVVDDGSLDDIAGALAPFGESVRLLRQNHAGVAVARNHALEKARGDFIAFLDADDYWEPARLERQLDVFEKDPAIGLVASRFFEELPGHERTIAATPLPSNSLDCVLRETGERAFALATRIWTSTVLVRRIVIGAHRFVSGLEPAEDRDLWARLVPTTAAYMVSEPLATAVLHPGSLSRSNIDVDCGRMLTVVQRHSSLLGTKGLRRWEAHTYRRWAGNHLDQGRASEALSRAWRRLVREPAVLEAWWVFWKSVVGTVCARRPRDQTFPNGSIASSLPKGSPVRQPTR